MGGGRHGRINVFIDGRIRACMDRWLDGCGNGCVDERVEELVHGIVVRAWMLCGSNYLATSYWIGLV